MDQLKQFDQRFIFSNEVSAKYDYETLIAIYLFNGYKACKKQLGTKDANAV